MNLCIIDYGGMGGYMQQQQVPYQHHVQQGRLPHHQMSECSIDLSFYIKKLINDYLALNVFFRSTHGFN